MLIASGEISGESHDASVDGQVIMMVHTVVRTAVMKWWVFKGRHGVGIRAVVSLNPMGLTDESAQTDQQSVPLGHWPAVKTSTVGPLQGLEPVPMGL